MTAAGGEHVSQRISDWEAHRPNRAYLLPGLVGAGLWELAGRLLDLPFFVPFSSAVLAGIRLLREPEVQEHLLASLSGLLIGFLLAALLGMVVGTLMGRYRAVENLFDLYLDAFLASPSLIYVPILFAFFGVGRTTQVAVIFLYSFFVIVAYTITGVQSVDRSLLEMARAFGANERRLFLRVTLPASFPTILTGLRIGAGRAVKGMINGEMFIAFTGLGALLRTAGDRYETPRVWGLLLIILTIALVFIGLLQALSGRSQAWFGGTADDN